MDPMAWLNGNVPGFAKLRPEDREAIAHFTLLWSLFESTCLNDNASSAAIHRLVRSWAEDHRLDEASFAEALAYFRRRYFENGTPTRHFRFLRLRPNDMPDLVEKVLRGDDNDPANCVTSVLIVVYRLRNNLFHGLKWAYGLRGQLGNFKQANKMLMNAMRIAEQRRELVVSSLAVEFGREIAKLFIKKHQF